MAILSGIAIKPHGKSDMQLCEQASLTIEAGVEGDSRGQPGPRQVTVLSLTAWREACDELGVELDWTRRRANLLVDGLSLDQTKGQYLLLGDAVLEITGETDPCARMEKVYRGLLKALSGHWRGGVTCKVLKPGQLHSGMSVQLVKTPS